MEIIFNTKTVPYCREVFRETKTVQEHIECVVSDVNDDIGKIAWSEAQICLKSKEFGALDLSVGAAAELSVFYLSEERDRVLSMRLSRDFAVDFSCGELSDKADVQVSLSCQGVQARVLNPRKLAVDLTVRAEAVCFVWDDLIVSLSADESAGGELQLYSEQSDCVVCTQICEKSFIVSEQIPVMQEGIVRLLSSHAELVGRDCQMIGEKALIKGEALLRFGCEMREGSAPVFLEQSIPFSALIDSGDEACALGELILQPTALYAELSDAINGGRVIELELHAAAQAQFIKNVTLDYIVDAYSTLCPLQGLENTVTVSRGGAEFTLTGEARDEISLEDAAVSVLSRHAQILSFAAKESVAAASALISLLLQNADGSYGCVQKLMSFEWQLPSAACKIDSVRITELSARTGDGKMEIRASAVLRGTESAVAECRYLSGAELDTENRYDPASLPALTVVSRRGRSLWELAKRYHSCRDAIERLNDKHPMSGDQLMIPRL